MEWKLTDEQTEFAEVLRSWIAEAAPMAAVHDWFDAGDPAPFLQRFVGDGWVGIGFDEQLGGQGGDLVELAITAEELGRGVTPSGPWLASTLALPVVMLDENLRDRILGGEIATVLQSSAVIPSGTDAVRVDAEGRLTGTVRQVLAADRATILIAVVETNDGPQLRVLEADQPGVAITGGPLLDRSRSAADVVLDGAPSTLIEVDASEVMSDFSSRAAVLVAADALGAMQRMLDLAVEYSKQRRQFGVPIGSFQAVKHAAAQILVSIEAGRSLVYFAAASVAGRGSEHEAHAAAAKVQVTQAAAAAADSALTMMGAIGYTWEHELHLSYKRAKLDASLFGTASQWNEQIAEALTLI